MEDFSEIAFEVTLQPSLLDEKVFKRTPSRAENKAFSVGVLRELLTQLSTMTKTQMAANNEGQPQQNDPGSLKKKAYIQLMSLRIAAFLSWDLQELNDAPSSQLLLLETLMAVADQPESKVKEEDVAHVKNGDKSNAKLFAATLYNRWVLRTMPLLNYPSPPANKAQIFSSKGDNFYCAVDPPTATTINSSSSTAFKAIKEVCDSLDASQLDHVPSENAFKIGTNVDTEFVPEFISENWIKLEKGTWIALALYDFIGHLLFIEDYAGCRHYLKLLKAIDDKVLSAVLSIEVLSAYEIATMEVATVKAKKTEEPLYHLVNEELACKYKGQSKAYESLAVKNAPLRIEAGLPIPQTEEALKKAELKGLETFALYLNGSKTVSYGKPPSFSEKSDRSSKSKAPKNVRKRDLLLALMREKRPDKILELIQDLQKMSVNIRRCVSRWHLDDLTVVRAAGRAIDSDYVFVLLVKVQQLIEMKDFGESMALVAAVERVFNDKPWSNEKAKATQYLQMQKVLLKMTEYQECKGQNMDDLEEFTKDVKDCFDKLTTIANASEGHSQVFEMVVVTLLNLDQFDFILSRSDKCWNLIRLSCLISSAVINFHRKYFNTGEFKETCRALADIILPVLQQSSHGGSKRSAANRDLSLKESQEKQWIKRLLKRIHSPQVLSLLAAFLVTYYNSINEDASLEIQCELPLLPLTVNSSITINEDSLLSFIQMLAKNSRNPSLSWSLRIQGEVNFAQGNYLAAMQNFIKALSVSSHYFQKPWNQMQSISDSTWDERMFVKMIKCTSELGHHAESMVLCQYQSEVDYVTAFKALEERNSFDAMDSLYAFVWDVTILEYAVSMHNKKGEMSRKRKALETISQLEINTNNNEEILREAQAARRSSFLRYMAANYLQ